jgi:hypothetical protein
MKLSVELLKQFQESFYVRARSVFCGAIVHTADDDEWDEFDKSEVERWLHEAIEEKLQREEPRP